MSRRRPPSIAADFADVTAYLRSRYILGNLAQTSVDQLKAVHRSTLSMILWRFRLRGLPEYSRVFIEEIASDALQILPQVALGFDKPTRLLIRGIVENVLRHIYFTDHSVEFERMNSTEAWYLRVSDLFEYVKSHPRLKPLADSFDSLSKLQDLYDELSAGVHGRTVQNFQMEVALSKIILNPSQAEAQARLCARCAEATNFLLAAFNIDKFRGFEAEDRRMILQTMPAKARNIITSHET